MYRLTSSSFCCASRPAITTKPSELRNQWNFSHQYTFFFWCWIVTSNIVFGRSHLFWWPGWWFCSSSRWHFFLPFWWLFRRRRPSPPEFFPFCPSLSSSFRNNYARWHTHSNSDRFPPLWPVPCPLFFPFSSKQKPKKHEFNYLAMDRSAKAAFSHLPAPANESTQQSDFLLSRFQKNFSPTLFRTLSLLRLHNVLQMIPIHPRIQTTSNDCNCLLNIETTT